MSSKLISHKESKEARQRAIKLIEDVRKHHDIHGNYKFFHRPIGSGKRRCIVKDKDGKYDLDYQIVLTINSKAGDADPSKIKADFLQAFTDCKNNNEKVENSTTVVTVRSSKSNDNFDPSLEKISFDFVIISIDENKRIKRNSQSSYTWTELPSKNSYIYEKFAKLTGKEQRDLLEEYVIPRIIEEKNKDESLRIPTIDIFLQEVNNRAEKL